MAPLVADPRISPGSRAQTGRLNAAICHVIWRGAGTVEPPRLFTTLARTRGLFRRWLLFASGLMPGGGLPRRDTELVILRVAHLCDCEYEAVHHRPLALRAGLSAEDVARATEGPDAPGWESARQAALLHAVDELHARRVISDGTWDALQRWYSHELLLELCLLVGHYEMLAGTINSAGIEPDELRAGRSRSLLARLSGFSR